MSNLIGVLWLLSIPLSFYLNIKYFTRSGVDVTLGGAVVILLVSSVPIVNIVVGVMSYLFTIDFILFKGESK